MENAQSTGNNKITGEYTAYLDNLIHNDDYYAYTQDTLEGSRLPFDIRILTFEKIGFIVTEEMLSVEERNELVSLWRRFESKVTGKKIEKKKIEKDFDFDIGSFILGGFYDEKLAFIIGLSDVVRKNIISSK